MSVTMDAVKPSRASSPISVIDSTPAPANEPDEPYEPLARRPATLNVGKACTIGVNAFKVVKLPTFIVYHYDVQISPLKKAQSTRRESDKDLPPEVSRNVVEYMVDRSKMFGDINVGFDGKRNLYAPARLAQGDEKPFSVENFEIYVPDEEAPETNGHSNGRSNGYANGHSNGTNGNSEKPRGQGFTVRMKAVGMIDLSDLERFLGGNASSTEGVQLSLMALNVLINTMPASAYPSKKTSFFPPDIQRDATSQYAAGGGGGRGGRGGGRGGRGGGRGGAPPPPTLSHAFALSKGIEVWRGYFTSLRPTLGKLIVNVDVTHQPFVSAGSMIAVALAITGGSDPRNLMQEMRDRRRGWVELERVLRGAQIGARFGTHTADVHRRKIKELGKVGANKQVFDFVGERMSVADYWHKTYNRALQYPDLPCIRVSATAWYPIEVCDLMIGNKYNKTLSPDQVAQAIKFTTVKPRERMEFIRKIQFLRPSTNPALTAWGMEFENDTMKVEARTLDPPVIKLKGGRSRSDQTTRPSEGQWNMQKPDQLGFFRPATLSHWAVVVFKPERNSFFAAREAQQSIGELCRAMTSLGMEVTNTAPRIYFTENEDYNDVARIFKSIGKDHHQQYNAVPQLIVCYLAKQSCPDYAQIKQFGDVEHGVATQCMLIEKVKTKGNNAYYSNVALKINPKLAGINQILDSGALQGFDDVPSMIFGADVTHPPPDSRDPSVSALVGSMDRYAATYGTTTRIQSSRQENIEGLEDMCLDLLKMFEVKNKRKPQRIIVFRDGVSEGQFQIVLRKEVSAFRAALQRFSEGSAPIKITYIVAAKRHHFRFFPESDRDAERSGNVKAGTVIDRDITDPTSWDWYLQSHGGLLGTSRSTHYTVLLDENNFSADKITSLTYNLCYLYARSTRSVSIVTPCYYAHHACVRAKLLSQPTNDDAHSSFSNASRGSQESAERAKQLAAYNKNLKPLHSKIQDTLYFL